MNVRVYFCSANEIYELHFICEIRFNFALEFVYFFFLIVGVIQFPLHQLLKWHKGNNLQSRWEFIQRPFRCMYTSFYFWCARINGNEWMKCVGQIKKKENTHAHTHLMLSKRKPLSTFTLCSCNMTQTVDCIYSDVQKKKEVTIEKCIFGPNISSKFCV